MSVEKINLYEIFNCIDNLQGLYGDMHHRITTNQIEENKKRLEAFGIAHSDGYGEIEINTDQGEYYIRYTKYDFMDACHDQYDKDTKAFRKPVVVISDRTLYYAGMPESEHSLFYKNLIASLEMETILKDIADFHDETKREFTLLSPKAGKETFSYRSRGGDDEFKKFLETGNLHETAKNLKDKIADPRFVGFLKTAFIEKSEINFFKALMAIDQICRVAQRNFDLYQTKYDFKNFEEGLLDAKRKYFEKYFDFQSTVLSKINGFPIQYGVYIFLLIRFSKEAWGLFATIVLLLAWSGMSLWSLDTMKKELKRFQDDFNDTLDRMKEESKMSSFDPKVFSERMEDHDKMIVSFQSFTIYSTVAFLAIAIWLLTSLYSDTPVSVDCLLYGQCQPIKP